MRAAPAVLPLLVLAALAAPGSAEATRVTSGPLDEGATWSHVFNETGTFPYHCAPHPWMKATVIVTAAAGNGTADVTIQGFKFHPQNATVHIGATVTWTNLDPAVHTVTQDEAAASGLRPWQVAIGVLSLVGLIALMARLLRQPKPPA